MQKYEFYTLKGQITMISQQHQTNNTTMSGTLKWNKIVWVEANQKWELQQRQTTNFFCFLFRQGRGAIRLPNTNIGKDNNWNNGWNKLSKLRINQEMHYVTKHTRPTIRDPHRNFTNWTPAIVHQGNRGVNHKYRKLTIETEKPR